MTPKEAIRIDNHQSSMDPAHIQRPLLRRDLTFCSVGADMKLHQREKPFNRLVGSEDVGPGP